MLAEGAERVSLALDGQGMAFSSLQPLFIQLPFAICTLHLMVQSAKREVEGGTVLERLGGEAQE